MRPQAVEPAAAHLHTAEQHDTEQSEHLSRDFDPPVLFRELALADVAAGRRISTAADTGNNVAAPHPGTGFLAGQQSAHELTSGS